MAGGILARHRGVQAQERIGRLDRKIRTGRDPRALLEKCLPGVGAPEIDGLVQIQNGQQAGLRPGQFVDVEIMGSDEHDLFGLAVESAG